MLLSLIDFLDFLPSKFYPLHYSFLFDSFIMVFSLLFIQVIYVFCSFVFSVSLLLVLEYHLGTCRLLVVSLTIILRIFRIFLSIMKTLCQESFYLMMVCLLYVRLQYGLCYDFCLSYFYFIWYCQILQMGKLNQEFSCPQND